MPGDPQQMAEFLAAYNREQRALYGYIRSLLFQREDAEEIFQETCIALWEHFDQFATGTDFGAWARQIARYRTLAFCKKKRRRETLLLGEDVVAVMAEAMEEDAARSDHRRRALQECTEKLRDDDHALIQRRYGERLTTVQLAEELGRPLNTIYKALQRIRRSLRLCIERTLARQKALGSDT